MPTYEYVCSSCGHTFDELESITAKPLLTCPHCGKDALQRGPGGGSGMIFKGSGFYGTDYKGEKKSSEKKSPKKPEEKKDSPPPAPDVA